MSCEKDDDVAPVTDYLDIINNTGENVILKTYEALALDASALKSATQALENNPSPANLDAAKIAWVAARSPWEQSEGFLFGPVDQEGWILLWIRGQLMSLTWTMYFQAVIH
ncbi:MAG: hypothetical protein IPL46_22990 [Saprospiraceae bacterium]|nr:hypothetical protein [Saprospiraceae bacterium]